MSGSSLGRHSLALRGAGLLALGLAACSGEAAPVAPGGGATGTGGVETGGVETGTPTDTADPVDADGDGTTVGQGDCDDADATVFPGAPERWGDGVDQDCDGADLTHAEACVAAAPCPDAVEIYASAEGWAGIEQCSGIAGTLAWTPQSGGGAIPNSCVAEVGGDVVIEGDEALSDLRPLQRLQHIEGDLKLISLPALEGLAGLESLRATGEHVLLLRNDRLTDLGALAGLERVGRKLWLEDNARLAEVDALLGVERVGESLRVTGNPGLCADTVDALVEHVRATNPDVEVEVGDNGGC